MSKSLFNSFEDVSSKAWKQKIQVDLKGADYNDTLIWKSNEDIDVKPFYHADEFETLPETSNTTAKDWKICQALHVLDAKEANLRALDAIARGAESLIFNIESETISIEDLFHNIDTNTTIIEVKCNFISDAFIKNLQAITHNNSVKNNANTSQQSHLNIHTDIIGNLAKTGNWYSNLKEDHLGFITTVKATNKFSINTALYQNAGASMVQQLAYSLAHANEYLNALDTRISNEEKQTLTVTFNVAVGSNYFFEIAKLKAIRNLWATLATAYNVNTQCRIIATPSKRNKTIYDYNVNMLRTTTECMSAILGGANSVCNLPYDALYHNENEFGDRIARNQLLVLKHESYFDKVNNPSDGAYYITHLTQQISEKALQLFKDIEASGGFLKQLKEGTIQRKIKENANKEQADFDAEKIVLLGSNKHPNLADKMKDNLDISPFLKVNKRKTIIEPIIEKRLSEKLEINRLNKE